MDNVDFIGAPLDVVRLGLRDIGYRDDLLRPDYGFADVLVKDAPARRIALAAFGQEPLSYRSACFGVLLARHADASLVRKYRALGAPQLLVLHPETGLSTRWKVGGEADPVEIEQIPIAALPRAMRDRRQEWNPEAVLRAKAIGFETAPTQLDFYDAALLPTLESAVFTRLDALIRHVTALGQAAYGAHDVEPLDPTALFQLIFRLITAKLLSDHGYPGGWTATDVREVLQSVAGFYAVETIPARVLAVPAVPQTVWAAIRDAFSFQNLSVEALALVYENTLVTREIRRAYGVHATPPEIAEYVVRALPLWTLPRDERRIFEPFAGAAPFLIAALSQLRALLAGGANTDARTRHAYFVSMLRGMELDYFAREVAHDSLIAADLPNGDGWQVMSGDFFADPETARYLAQAQVVLCNPPYEKFTPEERSANPAIKLPNKAAEALRRVLEHPPQMLGFVLPRVFTNGQLYRAARRELANRYNNIDLVALPEAIFRHSKAEVVLLIAYGKLTESPQRRSLLVERADYQRFIHTGVPTWAVETPLDLLQDESNPVLWVTPLHRVWAALAHLRRLSDVADVHRGIEYKTHDNAAPLISDTPMPGFVPGLATATDSLEPFEIRTIRYLNIDAALMLYKAYELPWQKPKVVANAARLASSRWIISAAVERRGFVCSQRFHAIWPKDDFPLEVLAAVLNGPVANAYLSEHRTSRDNQIRTVRAIPFPILNPAQVQTIVALVQDYEASRVRWQSEPFQSTQLEERCRVLLRQIDAEVLAAYDLAPRLERQLLDYFAGYRRPGPVAFTRYYPPGFRPAIPFRLYISGEYQASSARRTLARLPVLQDPAISTMVAELD